MPPKETTVPQGFVLETDRRIRERQANKSEDEEDQYEFHANPLPRKILERPVVGASSKCLKYDYFYAYCLVNPWTVNYFCSFFFKSMLHLN